MLSAKLEEMDGKFNQAFEKVFVLVEELAMMPSADAIQAPKQASASKFNSFLYMC